MGRGWRRAGKLSTAPVPYPTVVLQGDQAIPADQGLHRHQRERRTDSDLDSADRDGSVALPATAQFMEMESVESGGAVAFPTVRLSRSMELDQSSVLSTGGIGVSAAGLVFQSVSRLLFWTAESQSLQ